MTVIGKFMKRLGWVRAEGGTSQRFEGDPGGDPQFTGAIGSEVNWSFVPEAPIDAARAFDPNLAAPVHTAVKPPLPKAVQADGVPADEEENLWLAAVAKAKSREMPVVAAPASAEEEEEGEEDWEALMAAARQRAQTNSPVAQVLAVARERAKSEPPVAPEVKPVFATVPAQPAPPVDAASAQVERGAVAANDDRLAVQLSSLPVQAAPGNEDEEWLRLRAEVEAKENAENERKLRAMREIRRLRGNRGNTGNVPMTKPATRRFAAGTVQPPIVAAKKQAAVIVSPRPAKPGPAKPRAPKSIGATTTRSIPRITQRLKSS
jgi:hypothetical protein